MDWRTEWDEAGSSRSAVFPTEAMMEGSRGERENKMLSRSRKTLRFSMKVTWPLLQFPLVLSASTLTIPETPHGVLFNSESQLLSFSVTSTTRCVYRFPHRSLSRNNKLLPRLLKAYGKSFPYVQIFTIPRWPDNETERHKINESFVLPCFILSCCVMTLLSYMEGWTKGRREGAAMTCPP